MAEVLTVILAYALTFITPSIILGVGAMANENKVSVILSSVLLVTFLGYYHKIGLIPFWVLGLVFILISVIIGIMYNSIFGET